MSSLLKNLWQLFSGVERKLLLLFILVIVASTAALRWQNKNAVAVPAVGGEYTEGLVGQPQHINPLLAPANDVDADLSRIIFSGLLKFDATGKVVPDLAENLPTVSADGKEYTIKLRDKLYWHDGATLTTDDVVFTYETIQNPEFASPLRFSWNRVGVQKIDERTIKLVTRESSSTFLANLTVGIIPKHIWEGVPANSFALSKFQIEAVGSGPFQIKTVKRGSKGEVRSLTMANFPRYHDGRPYLKTLGFKFYAATDDLINAYQKREIMGLGYLPFDRSLFFEPSSKLRQILLPLPQYQAVFINRSKNLAVLGDARVRLALAKSLDKKKMIADVYDGKASEAYGPILSGQLGYHEQIPGADMNIFDPDKARALLEQSGWVLDPATGFRKDKQNRIITVELATNNFTPNIRVAEALKKMWEGIGVQVILKIETIGDLEEKYIRPRNYQLLLFYENIGSDPDPFSFWHSSQLHDPGLNLTNFANKTADKLLVDARANIPAADRAAKYKQFQEIFVGDVPALFLDRSVFVYNLPRAVQGFQLNSLVTPAERFTDINKWYIETKKVKK